MNDNDPPRMDEISFFVVWAYLMVLAIVLAPLIAYAIKGSK